jgi:hypothetical protein
MRSVARLLLVPCCALLAASAAGAQTTLYEHTPGGPGLWASDQGNDGSGFRVFDQFAIATSGQVTGARWRGTYIDLVTPANNPVAPDELSWVLTFWDGGTPDVAAGPLATRPLTVGEVTRTFVGFASFQGSTIPVYDYETAFAPWAFTGGAAYSFSVMARSTTYNPAWAWMPGTGGNGQLWQQQFPSPALVSHTGDRAFALVGTSVPEPGSLALLATGLAAVAGGAVRRRGRG